jgi:hypothetical protein
MEKGKISYAGVGASVAGVIGILGVYATWWETPLRDFNGTADTAGVLALAMSIGLFAFGAAYVVMSDPQIRRAMGALATLCAVILTLACVWGAVGADNVAPDATVGTGLIVSALGGVLGIAAGLLVVRDNQQAEAAAQMSADDGATV